MKELEKELSQKTSSLSELKQQLRDGKEREEKAHAIIRQLEDQVGINEDLAGVPQHKKKLFLHLRQRLEASWSLETLKILECTTLCDMNPP